MARNKDVFGFDELEKDFKKLINKYPDSADAFLMAQGRSVNKRVKQLSPVYSGKIPPSKIGKIKPGQFKRSWSTKKVKLYKGGTVRVVRVQSTAPHAHWMEYGHENVKGGKTRERGRKLNRVQRAVKGITSHGYTPGKHMLEKSISEVRKRFDGEAQKMLDKLLKDLEV